ncbi:MAG: DUF2117 domain-containing protein, partial [Methanobacterium sp.]|nr:DUF2117 domain-containing protein [Methanobacterium sp.]
MMKIGVVVHGPQIVDTGYAVEILKLLENYGEVNAILGGTMGRTAVIDAELEDKIDIGQKLLPSQSIEKLSKTSDIVVLINYGKSIVTGHAFGYKVFNRCAVNPNLLQIERPGEGDGTVIPWKKDLVTFAESIAKDLNLKLTDPSLITDKMKLNGVGSLKSGNMVHRKVAGVSADENILLNGIVVGRSTSENVILVAEDGILTQILGGIIKNHGVEKLGKIDLENAVVKTGLLRRSKVKPRII